MNRKAKGIRNWSRTCAANQPTKGKRARYDAGNERAAAIILADPCEVRQVHGGLGRAVQTAEGRRKLWSDI